MSSSFYCPNRSTFQKRSLRWCIRRRLASRVRRRSAQCWPATSRTPTTRTALGEDSRPSVTSAKCKSCRSSRCPNRLFAQCLHTSAQWTPTHTAIANRNSNSIISEFRFVWNAIRLKYRTNWLRLRHSWRQTSALIGALRVVPAGVRADDRPSAAQHNSVIHCRRQAIQKSNGFRRQKNQTH